MLPPVTWQKFEGNVVFFLLKGGGWGLLPAWVGDGGSQGCERCRKVRRSPQGAADFSVGTRRWSCCCRKWQRGHGWKWLQRPQRCPVPRGPRHVLNLCAAPRPPLKEDNGSERGKRWALEAPRAAKPDKTLLSCRRPEELEA